MVQRLAACLAAIALTTAVGCGEPKIGSPDDPAVSAAPEALTLDVFTGRKLTTTCSATLLTRKIALSSARCFKKGSDSAAIHAPFASQNKWSDVAKVHVFDETSDIAVLVLAGSILVSRYPRIAGEDFSNESVRQTFRTDAGMKLGEPVTIAEDAPAAHAMFVPAAHADVGGTFFFVTETGKHVITGITLGNGETTSGAYVAKITDPAVRSWIKDIAAAAADGGGSAASGSEEGTIRPLTAEDGSAELDDGEIETQVAELAGKKAPSLSTANTAFDGGYEYEEGKRERLARFLRLDVACKTTSTFTVEPR